MKTYISTFLCLFIVQSSFSASPQTPPAQIIPLAQAAHGHIPSQLIYEEIHDIHHDLMHQHANAHHQEAPHAGLVENYGGLARQVINAADDAGYIRKTLIQRNRLNTLVRYVADELEITGGLHNSALELRALTLETLRPLITDLGIQIQQEDAEFEQEEEADGFDDFLLSEEDNDEDNDAELPTYEPAAHNYEPIHTLLPIQLNFNAEEVEENDSDSSLFSMVPIEE